MISGIGCFLCFILGVAFTIKIWIKSERKKKGVIPYNDYNYVDRYGCSSPITDKEIEDS